MKSRPTSASKARHAGELSGWTPEPSARSMHAWTPDDEEGHTPEGAAVRISFRPTTPRAVIR